MPVVGGISISQWMLKKSTASVGKSSVGIDLGLKDFATCSDGAKIEAQKIYRGAEVALAVAQRANNKTRVKAIHAKIANRRKDFLHKLSTELVKNNGAIFVGDANASGLAKTKMAKSVLDAGWSAFRTMLKYKSDHAAVWFETINVAVPFLPARLPTHKNNKIEELLPHCWQPLQP